MALDELVQRLKRGDYTGAVEALSKHALSSTRIVHIETLTPVDATQQPGQGPTPVVLGSTVIGMHFDSVNDKAYRIIKIPSNFVGDASFHIHWSKNVNSNEAGKTVRWRLTYNVFNAINQNVTTGDQVIEWDDTYDDSGTTTRIIYRTNNTPAVGFVPGYYVGVKLEYVPAFTTLTDGPVLVSGDLLLRTTINADS